MQVLCVGNAERERHSGRRAGAPRRSTGIRGAKQSGPGGSDLVAPRLLRDESVWCPEGGVCPVSSVRREGQSRRGAQLGDEFLEFAASLYLQASPVATQECVRAFGETDFRQHLASLTVPTLVVHGDQDQIVPLEASGQRVTQSQPGAQLQVMKGAPHGLNATHNDEFNRILLEFLAG